METEPKTRSGRRKIVLPEKVLDALRMHCEQQDHERTEADAKTLSENAGGYSAYRGEISSLYPTFLKSYERSI